MNSTSASLAGDPLFTLHPRVLWQATHRTGGVYMDSWCSFPCLYAIMIPHSQNWTNWILREENKSFPEGWFSEWAGQNTTLQEQSKSHLQSMRPDQDTEVGRGGRQVGGTGGQWQERPGYTPDLSYNWLTLHSVIILPSVRKGNLTRSCPWTPEHIPACGNHGQASSASPRTQSNATSSVWAL